MCVRGESLRGEELHKNRINRYKKTSTLGPKTFLHKNRIRDTSHKRLRHLYSQNVHEIIHVSILNQIALHLLILNKTIKDCHFHLNVFYRLNIFLTIDFLIGTTLTAHSRHCNSFMPGSTMIFI